MEWTQLLMNMYGNAGLNYLGNSSLVHAQSIIATLAVQVRHQLCISTLLLTALAH